MQATSYSTTPRNLKDIMFCKVSQIKPDATQSPLSVESKTNRQTQPWMQRAEWLLSKAEECT